jgi:hypothetical protein
MWHISFQSPFTLPHIITHQSYYVRKHNKNLYFDINFYTLIANIEAKILHHVTNRKSKKYEHNKRCQWKLLKINYPFPKSWQNRTAGDVCFMNLWECCVQYGTKFDPFERFVKTNCTESVTHDHNSGVQMKVKAPPPQKKSVSY